jgi:hypothetical protein
MNYSGFGTDPNYMYSFRQAGYNPRQSTIDAMSGGQDAFRSLRESLAYGQAGMEGKQRMERVVSMGLPANTDINKIQRVGYDPEMRRPVFAAPRPQPFGTFGSIGMDEEPPTPTPTTTPTGITQAPSLTQATELRETMLGPTGQPLAFTGFGQTARNQKADQYQTPVGRGLAASSMQVPSTRFGDVSLRFPFAGAESAFERTTRTATTFGGTPMFPSSRFGGPQPAERLGPVDAQPRRSWMY